MVHNTLLDEHCKGFKAFRGVMGALGAKKGKGFTYRSFDALERARPDLAERLHPALPYRASEVVWAARFEMARTVEDVLSRRLRALLLDARASVEMAPRVARLMAEELGRDEAWVESQMAEYTELARGYVL